MTRLQTPNTLRLSTHRATAKTGGATSGIYVAFFCLFTLLLAESSEALAAIPVYSDAVALVGRWGVMGLPSSGCIDATPAVSMPASRFTFMQAAGVIEGGTAQGFWVCGGTIIYEFNAAAVWATWYGWAKPDPGNATESVCTFRFCANSSPLSISVEVDAFTVVGVVAP